IPSVAVPLSLVTTFGVMYLLDYSLDNFSLMALTISTGFVVDDAIVMVENITRHSEHGLPPLEAALRGAKQIGFTIVSITASLLAVFVPLLLMGGMAGMLFREFAITLAVAVVVSALISLTLTPTLASRLLRRGKRRSDGGWFAWLSRGDDRALACVLRHRFATGVVMLGTVALSVSLYVFMPKGLFPQQDTGLLNGFSDAPQDISFPAMRARSEALMRILGEEPDIDHANSFIGGQGVGNTGTAFIALRPRNQRKASADQIIARLRPKLLSVPGIALYLQSVQDVRIGGRFARTQYQYTLQDANLDELMAFAPRMASKLRTLPMVRDVATDQQTAGLALDVVVDRDSAARLGVTMKAIDDTLYDAFGQRQVATLYGARNQYHVVLEVKPERAQTPEAVG